MLLGAVLVYQVYQYTSLRFALMTTFKGHSKNKARSLKNNCVEKQVSK